MWRALAPGTRTPRLPKSLGTRKLAVTAAALRGRGTGRAHILLKRDEPQRLRQPLEPRRPLPLPRRQPQPSLRQRRRCTMDFIAPSLHRSAMLLRRSASQPNRALPGEPRFGAKGLAAATETCADCSPSCAVFALSVHAHKETPPPPQSRAAAGRSNDCARARRFTSGHPSIVRGISIGCARTGGPSGTHLEGVAGEWVEHAALRIVVVVPSNASY